MPLAALVPRPAPPTRAVAVPAPVYVPRVRTGKGLLAEPCASTRKSVGSVAVAEVPIASKFCVYAVLVERLTAAFPAEPSRANPARSAVVVGESLGMNFPSGEDTRHLLAEEL